MTNLADGSLESFFRLMGLIAARLVRAYLEEIAYQKEGVDLIEVSDNGLLVVLESIVESIAAGRE
jgi:hypothetical protein